MKKYPLISRRQRAYTLLMVVCLLFLLHQVARAQAPERFTYQAIIRNNQGAPVSSTTVTIRISIIHGTVDGAIVYSETQTPTTNINGLISIDVGDEAGFNAIKWADGPYFIRTETDPTGGHNFTLTGTSQLLSVPYALYAETAERLVEQPSETDPLFAASVAAGISVADTARWNKKPDELVEKQGLADVVAINNEARRRIRELSDPTHPQDAVTKAFMEAYIQQRLQELGIIPVFLEDPRDGNRYKTVTIGNQIWMAENLKYLPSVNSIDYRSFCNATYYVPGYDGESVEEAKATEYYKTYGVLYNWTAAMNYEPYHTLSPIQGACPPGWHLPSDSDWIALVAREDVGKIVEAGNAHWEQPHDSTNELGFTAIPGGVLLTHTNELSIGHLAAWWSTREGDEATSYAYYNLIYIYNRQADIWAYEDPKSVAVSVRCLKYK
jgi:uncharacterized protein (TIGR02145 family)